MTTYSHLDVLFACPTRPLAKEKRVYQLTRMYEGLRSLEVGETPTPEDWACVSDCVLLMQVLRDMKVVEDPQNAIEEALDALGRAGHRHMSGSTLRLDGPSIGVLRGVLSDYAEALEQIPARTMVNAHRTAEKRAQEILRRTK